MFYASNHSHLNLQHVLYIDFIKLLYVYVLFGHRSLTFYPPEFVICFFSDICKCKLKILVFHHRV